MSNFNPYMQMPYGTSLSQYPQRTMWPQTAAQGSPRQLVRVSGMDGARAYQMAPNEVVALFDEGDDILSVKSTAGAGFPTIRRFRFREEADAAPAAPVPAADYVTRAEFDELKGLVMANGKHAVRKQQSDPDA